MAGAEDQFSQVRPPWQPPVTPPYKGPPLPTMYHHTMSSPIPHKYPKPRHEGFPVPSFRPMSAGHDSQQYKRSPGAKSQLSNVLVRRPARARTTSLEVGKPNTAPLSPEEAFAMTSQGSLTFRGAREPIPHAEGCHRYYATAATSTYPGEWAPRPANSRHDERARFQNSAFQNMTLRTSDIEDGMAPWDSLEQPSMGWAFGRSPGTTTLSWFVASKGDLRPPLVYASRARPRKLKLVAILERLSELEVGLEFEHPDSQYQYLYEKLIEDPEKYTDPHYDRAMQIADLITVLSNPDWIDFSQQKNQVVAKFFDSPDEKTKTRFFHQLLLAVELHLRIQASDHLENAKRHLLGQLPPKVAWDLALAQRWLENMSISKYAVGEDQSQFTFDLRSKRRQKEALKQFARLLKWPNMEELEYVLQEQDDDVDAIEDRSADTMSWFTGVVLPGPTLPFLLMNSVIDCDEDTGGALGSLTHVKPNCGFQYRANTYWSWKCILGKVLGASRGVKQVAGWIGPCHFSPDLARMQCVLVRARVVKDKLGSPKRLSPCDIDEMGSRSDPLGDSDTDTFFLADFNVPEPAESDPEEDIIRIQKLSFRPIPDDRVLSKAHSQTYRAAVVFAFAETTLPMSLNFDVDFVMAPRCDAGPHALWKGYRTHSVRVVDGGLSGLNGWPSPVQADRPDAAHAGTLRAPHPWMARLHDTPVDCHETEYRRDWDETGWLSDGASPPHALALARRTEPHSPPRAAATTLVVEALSVSDNEVFARAWCAHWGLHSVVANVRQTCTACAVRMARACGMGVVVLTEGGRDGERDRGVRDLLTVVG